MPSQHAFPPIGLDDLAPPGRRPQVAVLPFSNTEADASLRLLGSQAGDLLRNSLARIPEVGAILISSEFLSRAPEHALELICRQLRVGYLVSGRCYRLGAGTALYVELADTRHWHILWADFFFRRHAHELLDADSDDWVRMLAGLRHTLQQRPRR